MKWLFVAVLVVPGLIWLGLVVPRAIAGLQTLSWQPTDGKVMQSESEYDYNSQLWRTKGTFLYRYTVDGTAYTSSRVGYAGLSGAGWATWEAGQSVTVYVKPGDPEQAVLERGIDWWSGLQLGGGLLLVLGGGIGFWFSHRAEQESDWLEQLVVDEAFPADAGEADDSDPP